jgi:TIR domain
VTAAPNPYVFLSYSRAQLALAESLTLTAIEYGLNVWFDLLALLPGVAWDAGIRAGLESAGGVVFLVSRDSLASPYVAEEVGAAIQAGKRLFLVLTEAVEPRLKHAPQMDLAQVSHSTIDMRADFSPAFKKLFTAIRTGVPCRDPLPTPGFFQIFAHTPRHIQEVIGGILAPAGVLVAIGLYWLSGGVNWDALHDSNRLAQITLFNLVQLPAIVLWCFGCVYFLLRRRLSMVPFTTALAGANVFVFYFLLWQGRYLQNNPLLNPAMPIPAWCGYSLAFAGACVSGLAVYRLMTSVDTLRWIPANDRGLYNLARNRQVSRVSDLVLALQQKAQRPSDPRPYFYRLHYAAADEPIARVVHAALKKGSMSERAPSELPPTFAPGTFPNRVDLDFLLLTSRLDERRVTELLASRHGYLIALLAAPVRLSDAMKKALGQLQWVEFRGTLGYQIGFLTTYLRGFEASRARYAANFTPASSSALVLPLGVTQLVPLLHLIGAITLASGIVAWISPALAKPISPFLPWAVPLGIWQFAMVHFIYSRTFSFWPFLAQLAVNLGLTTWLGVPRLLVRRFAVQGYFDVGIKGVGDTNYLLFLAGVYGLILVFGLWHLATRWLPAPVKSEKGAFLAGSSHLVIAQGHLFYGALVVVIAAYMIMNGSG